MKKVIFAVAVMVALVFQFQPLLAIEGEDENYAWVIDFAFGQYTIYLVMNEGKETAMALDGIEDVRLMKIMHSDAGETCVAICPKKGTPEVFYDSKGKLWLPMGHNCELYKFADQALYERFLKTGSKKGIKFIPFEKE
jgi:hypothetical protein